MGFRTKCLGAVATFAALVLAASAARAQLPPEVQADMMVRELVQAVEAKDYKAVVIQIEKMREVTPDLPPDVLFYEADARVKTGYLELGRKALDQYLTAAGRSGAYYQQALELYADLKKRALETARKFLEYYNKQQIEASQFTVYNAVSRKFALFETARLKRPDLYEVFGVHANRKQPIFSDIERNACHPRINDQVSLSVAVQPKGAKFQNNLVRKQDALVWSNVSSIDLRRITKVRSVDMFDSSNGVTNFMLLEYPADFQNFKFRFNDDRFVGFSGGGQSHVSAKGILLFIPDVDTHKSFVADLKRVIEFCRIAQGDI